MLILSIETSCDDCSVAMVRDGRDVLALKTASQVDTHNKTGGVVPEVAAREHAVAIIPTIESALADASLKLDEVDAIAVTQGPGLMSSLMIGTMTAATLALSERKPLIPVHHILGHVYGNWLERSEAEFQFPIMILTASGGHNHLILMRSHLEFEIVGSTRDDAAGEAFDKVSRMLGLGYPGGPAIEKAALDGDPSQFKLPTPHVGDLEFSFSGLKSEMMRVVIQEKNRSAILSSQFVADLAASFQRVVIDTLTEKLFKAAAQYSTSEVHLCGGVSANSALRESVEKEAHKRRLAFKAPLKKVYSTDNGAMIGARAYFQARECLETYTEPHILLPDPGLKF